MNDEDFIIGRRLSNEESKRMEYLEQIRAEIRISQLLEEMEDIIKTLII